MGAHVTAAGIGVLLTTLYQLACATDPTQLQDFCVATNDIQNALFVNGIFCKNSMEVEAEDFLFKGLNVAGNRDNQLGSDVTRVDVKAFPTINTLEISLARMDLSLYGVNPPHIHPRATEVTMLLEGCAYVGFVSSNNDGNRLFTKILYLGDVFVFPQGMVHFEFNVGMTPAVLLVAFSSQEPGVSTIANATFGSNPPIEGIVSFN